MIKREQYLQQIRPFIDQPFIKVLTGIRRCGKSSILMMIKEELEQRGVGANNILYINFENLDFAFLDTAMKLHDHIKNHIPDKGRCYILLDEIQEVQGWEKAVNSFLATGNADIYITGSNSRLLSSEFATYIAGRYIDIKIHTLSFNEYLLFKESRTGEKPSNLHDEIQSFIRLGGFPAVHLADYGEDVAYQIINDIYSSALLRDVVQRFGIRNVDVLQRLAKYAFDNVGNSFSAKNIADYFKSQGRRIEQNTIYSYLYALESAFIIRKVPRYDLKGRGILQSSEKYFLGDQSLAYAVMGYKNRLISGIMENIVMLELERRGYQVYVDALGVKEIDFIAERRNEKVYVQVSYTPTVSENTITRELSPLLAIKDNYPKYIVTMDDFWRGNIEGVQHSHLADFLLLDEY